MMMESPYSVEAAFIPRRQLDLPQFPLDVLPTELADFVSAIAEEKQVSPDMAVGFALGVISAAVVGRVEVRPNGRQPNYTEAAQLFLLVQGESGERKSATFSALDKPLVEYLAHTRAEVKKQNADILRKVEAIERQLRTIKGTNIEEYMNVCRHRDEVRETIKAEPEVIRSEGTVEALTQSMMDHSGRVIIMGGEGQFLNNLTGRSYGKPGSAVNIDAILDGYGNGAVSGMRVRDKAEWDIPRASVALCLGVQPELLGNFVGDREGQGRGLQGRFLFFLPNSRIGSRRVDTAPVPGYMSEWWKRCVQRIAALARDGNPLILDFDAAAEFSYFDFVNDIEKRLHGDLGGVMQPWGGKIAGNTVRIAGLLALVEGAHTVTSKHWDAARKISEGYLIPHAVRAFLGADPALNDADQKLLACLRGVDVFSESQMWADRVRYIFENHRQYEISIQQLARNGYIALAERQEAYNGVGRKPKPNWKVMRKVDCVGSERGLF